MKWRIYAGDQEYDREVTRGQCFGTVEAETFEQAQRLGSSLLGPHVCAGAWPVPEQRCEE